MSDDEQKQLQQMFDAMGNSGGRFVIGQVIGSQTFYYGNEFADKARTAEAGADESSAAVSDNDIIKEVIQQLKAEEVIEHLYDYTWVMLAMNDTKGLPSFDSPQSFKTTYAASIRTESPCITGTTAHERTISIFRRLNSTSSSSTLYPPTLTRLSFLPQK